MTRLCGSAGIKPCANPFAPLPEDYTPYNGTTKLTASQVNLIRAERYEQGLTLKVLSERYNVSLGAIWRIVTTQTYGDIGWRSK